MPRWICVTCSNSPLASPSEHPPASCQICVDERQYVGVGGSGVQEWTTLDELKANGKYKNVIRRVNGAAGKVFEIFTTPSLGIGQRVLLALTPHGAVLFDSIAYIDDATVSVISNILGPQKLAAIVISHPHFYNSMTLWSRRFGCPVYVHADDAEWIPADDKEFVTLWKGDTLPIFNQHAKREENGKRVFGAEAIHVGGHFAGSTVCIVQTTDDNGPQILLSSDSFLPTPRHDSVSLMYSFPNLVPLPPSSMIHTFRAIEEYEFDLILGAFPGRNAKGGRETVRGSVQRVLGKMESALKL